MVKSYACGNPGENTYSLIKPKLIKKQNFDKH